MARTKIYKFPNGATIIYRRRKSNNATAVNVGFRCGHQYANNGLPHFFEHMFFKGTTKRSKEDIIDDRNKITFLNAYTNNDVVCVTFFQSNKRVEQSFEYASDVLLNSTFEEDQLKNEVKVILEEKVRYIDSGRKSLLFMHDIFIKTKYESMEKQADRIFGTDEFLNSISQQDLFNFRDQHFVADKFIISVVSSLSFSKIKRLVKKHFLNKIKSAIEPSVILPQEIVQIDAPEGVNVVKNTDKSYKVVFTIKQKVEPDQYRFDYNPDCLNSVISKRKDMYHYMVRQEGLAYSCRAGINYNNGAESIWYGIDTTTSSLENLEKILSIFGDSIIKLKKEGIKTEEIDQFRENHLVSRDVRNPISYKDMVIDILDKYLAHGDEKPKTKKQIDKYYDQITEQSLKEIIEKFFLSSNDVHMTIMGDVDEKQLKNINDYKKLVFKDL